MNPRHRAVNNEKLIVCPLRTAPSSVWLGFFMFLLAAVRPGGVDRLAVKFEAGKSKRKRRHRHHRPTNPTLAQDRRSAAKTRRGETCRRPDRE
jgi:hypothetical protein